MTTRLTEKKIKALIKEGVREGIKEELMELRALAVLPVSKAEQRDVEKRYGKPSQKTHRTYRIKV